MKYGLHLANEKIASSQQETPLTMSIWGRVIKPSLCGCLSIDSLRSCLMSWILGDQAVEWGELKDGELGSLVPPGFYCLLTLGP